MNIAVLMGGSSGEHDVSLRSGAAVLAALAARGHELFALIFPRSRHGLAHFGPLATPDASPPHAAPTADALAALAAWNPTAAFIAMHGEDGEDGRIQGALELLGIPYQGSGVQASAIGLDKIRSKEALRAQGLPLASDRTLSVASPPDWAELTAALGLPLVLKTPASGSSVGVALAATLTDAQTLGAAMLASAGRLLAETFIPGRELTVPVLDSLAGRPEALPAIEIRPHAAAFFDYATKYDASAVDELCPAPISSELEHRLRSLAVAAHQALGCTGYSRTDFRVAQDGAVVILEVNTLPGLTPESLLPRSAATADLPFPDLIERLILRALATHAESPQPT